MPAIITTKTDPILNIAKHLDEASENELVLIREHIALKLDEYFSEKIKKTELIDWAEYVHFVHRRLRLTVRYAHR